MIAQGTGKKNESRAGWLWHRISSIVRCNATVIYTPGWTHRNTNTKLMSFPDVRHHAACLTTSSHQLLLHDPVGLHVLISIGSSFGLYAGLTWEEGNDGVRRGVVRVSCPPFMSLSKTVLSLSAASYNLSLVSTRIPDNIPSINEQMRTLKPSGHGSEAFSSSSRSARLYMRK